MSDKENDKQNVVTKGDVARGCFEQIQYWALRSRVAETLSYACNAREMSSEVAQAFSTISRYFIEMELRAWRGLITWNVLTGLNNPEIRRAVLKRFYREDMSVAHFLSDDGTIPGSWLGEDEENIRDIIEEARAEIDGEKNEEKPYA